MNEGLDELGCMISFCDQCMNRGLRTDAKQPGIAAYFIQEYRAEKTQANELTKERLPSGNTASVVVGERYDFFESDVLV